MNRLEELRKKNNLSQGEFAKAIGISTPRYHMYEKGKRTIPEDIAKKIANLVGCKKEDIFLPNNFTIRE